MQFCSYCSHLERFGASGHDYIELTQLVLMCVDGIRLAGLPRRQDPGVVQGSTKKETTAMLTNPHFRRTL